MKALSTKSEIILKFAMQCGKAEDSSQESYGIQRTEKTVVVQKTMRYTPITNGSL